MSAPSICSRCSAPTDTVKDDDYGQVSVCCGWPLLPVGWTPPALGWEKRPIGEHWINARYPSATVSSVTHHLVGGARKSGYVATVNFAELGVFHTRELAQRAVEAHLGDA